MRIGVYGNLTLDEIERDGKYEIRPGGSALYSSLTAAYLGSNVSVISNIGRDYPRKTLSRLKTHGVDTSGIRELDGPTTRFRISYRGDSRRLELIHSGQRLKLAKVSSSLKAIHLGPVFKEIGLDILNDARSHSRFLSVDLQGLLRTTKRTGIIRLTRRRIDPFLSKCDLVKATEHEMRVLAPTGTIVTAARRLLAKGAKYAIVTRGKSGSLLLKRDGGAFRIPSVPERRTTDRTGAGDIFAGSWLTTYMSVGDALWAGAVGAAFASLSLRDIGFSKFKFARDELFRRASWAYRNSRAVKG